MAISTRLNWCRYVPVLVALFAASLLAACNSEVEETVKDAVDLADGVPRKTLDTGRLGINAFANDDQFGSAASQYEDVRSTLGMKRVRVLFAWNEGVQSGPGAAPQFGFYDHLLASMPSDMEVLVILTGIPRWLQRSEVWTDGNPRINFVDDWVAPAVKRYGSDPRIVGFQIWNEPNMSANVDNVILGISDSPENYVEMLARAENVVREHAPGKLVVSAATTAINQDFPRSLDYNRKMRDAGAREVIDVWAIHYYGKQYENVLRDGGVKDFIDGLGSRVWVTESGAQGVNEQLAYGEQAWSFLFDKIPAIERIYIYQYTENSPAESTYGLRNPSSSLPVSDLYVWLRDNR